MTTAVAAESKPRKHPKVEELLANGRVLIGDDSDAKLVQKLVAAARPGHTIFVELSRAVRPLRRRLNESGKADVRVLLDLPGLMKGGG
jgi:hypothetical protein